MILKSYELTKLDLKKNNLFLFYGQNEGFKNEVIKNLFGKNNEINVYDEKELLDNPDNFIENIQSKSLFETEKKILIKRSTNKILSILSKINTRDMKDVFIIINAGNLEKKSKLRNIFEKEKTYICVPFYPDNEQTLSKIAFNFFKVKKIPISSLNLSFIVSKCSGDREMLINELNKIEFFLKSGKKLNSINLAKLVNLSEDHSVAELIDNCLAKNEKKTINIINENNLTSEDCILITRTFLNKSKKIYKLCCEYKKNKNIDLTISSATPKIFWKDIEITKKQIYQWSPRNIKQLIYKLNDIELLLKKNIGNSVNLITDFIIEQANSKTNS
tara:strand:- start:1818 stop:2810 length:993 start_codon:yes stop_codon:yes gene_type:complete